MVMVVLMGTSAVGQSFPPPPVANSGNTIEAAFELLKKAPLDERACAGAGGIVLANAVCFPRRACAIVDTQNVEHATCLSGEPAAEEPEVQRPAAHRRTTKTRSHKR